jgi:hypothetical protein
MSIIRSTSACCPGSGPNSRSIPSAPMRRAISERNTSRAGSTAERAASFFHRCTVQSRVIDRVLGSTNFSQGGTVKTEWM